MKKIFTICAAASLLFAACKSETKLDAKKDVVLVDTTGMYKSNASTDVSTPVVQEVAPTKIIRETRIVYVDRTPKVKRHIIREASPVVNNPVAQVPQTKTESVPAKTSTAQTSTGTTNGGTETSTGTVPEKVEKDKGWSQSTKGAVIGGVGGAVTGAILSKNKVKGAIIGGVLGAAGGYVIGRDRAKRQNGNY